MAGIGHLLAEGEMQKEALSPYMKGTLRSLAIGAASLVGAGYVGHRYGKYKADQDFQEGTYGRRKPNVGTFLAGGLGAYMLGGWPWTAATSGVSFAREGYDERWTDRQQGAPQ